MAWSQLTTVHWPPASFIGYFSRRSPLTSSRTEAPLAQCEPRLIGESQLGSWPIHTPFTTSAVTVQPTLQWVQMFLRITAPMLSGPVTAASALRTVPSRIVPSTARRWWRLAPRCRKPKPIRKTTMKSAKLATKRTLRTSKRFTASTTIPSEGGNRADQEDRSSGAPRLPCGARRPNHCSRPASVFAPFRDRRRQPRRAWHDATWDRVLDEDGWQRKYGQNPSLPHQPSPRH